MCGSSIARPQRVGDVHRIGLLRCNEGPRVRTALAQARSPWPDPKGLLARQMIPHIPDSAAAATRMIAVCHFAT